ncbi:MAG: gamma-glutamyltranspeptidase/glutathione hydrolase, partial [Halioglobus sp.]
MSKLLSQATFALFVTLLSQNTLSSTAAVSMSEPQAAAVAKNVLMDGGNAIDAAIASAFVLAVTYPEAGNIGGGGFMLSYMNNEAAFLDFRERAPSAAHRDMYLNENGNVIPNASLLGGQASGVPGTVKGMLEAHKRYGTVPWEKLLQPAIGLAKHGFTVPAILAEYAQSKIKEVPEPYNFKKYFGHMRAGKLFTQPELAATLELIAQDPDTFYTGLVATQIASQMQKIGGLITRQDLADYKAIWRTPLQSQWRGYSVLTAPPPSSGGFALIQLLAMRDYAKAHFQDIAHNAPRYVHLLAEIEKRVFADRAVYLGDPDFVDIPMQQLLAPEYLAKRAAAINPTAISPVAKVPAGLESTDTTHFSILDHQGNAVSLTYTLNWEFGSGVVVEG